MEFTGFIKRLQTGDDEEDRKIIQGVFEGTNSLPDDSIESEKGSGKKSKSPEDKSKVVLHIDDDPEDRELVYEAIKLIDRSIVVHNVENGREGIDFLNKAKFTGSLPCLIILDMNMKGMNGLETYNEIQKSDELKSIPVVIFTTATGFKEIENKGKEPLPVFIKPDSTRAFNITIKAMLTYCL
jgi:CheY-like chemotaxis protein